MTVQDVDNQQTKTLHPEMVTGKPNTQCRYSVDGLILLTTTQVPRTALCMFTVTIWFLSESYRRSLPDKASPEPWHLRGGATSYVKPHHLSNSRNLALARKRVLADSRIPVAIEPFYSVFTAVLFVKEVRERWLLSIMMSAKAQSPGPSATTSQATKQARSRKAAVPGGQSAVGRAGSAGGVVLEKEKEAVKKTTGSGSASAPASATTKTAKRQVEQGAAASPTAKDKEATDATTSTGPNRQRRRPRKLNRDAPTDDAPSASTSTSTSTPAPAVPPTAELEALKSRVRGLEAKVEDLYKSADSRPRSPRRRGKGRKTSSTQSIPTLHSTTNNTTAAEEHEEADEEILRAEQELESARHDLELYQPPRSSTRPKNRRVHTVDDDDEDDVEDIPRDAGEQMFDAEGRQVTLSGSYRIPLPATLKMEDVKTIQSGVSAAQSVARSFLEQRRASQAATATQSSGKRTASGSGTKAGGKRVGVEVSKETEGKSWGEWFGGYSVAISRAVKNLEAEAVVEGPGQGASTRRGAGKRPSARGRQSGGVA